MLGDLVPLLVAGPDLSRPRSFVPLRIWLQYFARIQEQIPDRPGAKFSP